MSSEWELQIAIVDDLEQDRMLVADLTEKILQKEKISHTIHIYENAQALLDAIHSGRQYNLLLLDVIMDEMDGMTLARELRNQGNSNEMVFISSSQELARRGYYVKAARYLLKPVDEAELAEALLYCYQIQHAKKEILLPTEKGQYRTSFPDIQLVEAFDRGTRFVLDGETVETRLKFSQAEAMLPKSSFLHCHRAYIVNLAQTKRISQYEFTMKSGKVVPISRLRYQEIYRQFMEFFRD